MLVAAVLGAVAVGVITARPRRSVRDADTALDAHFAELSRGPGWLPPPGWEAEQERINAAAAARTCTGCGFVAGEHVHGHCPGGDPDDWFVESGAA